MYTGGRARVVLSRDGRELLVLAGPAPAGSIFEELLLIDLAAHTSRWITTHAQRLWAADFDPSGRVIMTGDIDGVVQASPFTGEEPHLLRFDGGAVATSGRSGLSRGHDEDQVGL